MMQTNRRIGRFTVSDQLLHQSIDSGIAAKIFNGSVPLDVKRDWFEQSTTFLLWHPSFDACAEGSIVPEYVLIVKDDEITWMKSTYLTTKTEVAKQLTMSEFKNMFKGGEA